MPAVHARSGDFDGIFDAEWNSAERACGLAPRQRLVGGSRGGHRLPVEDFDHRMNPGIHGGDPVQVRLYQFDRGDGALAHQPRLLCGG